jgi:hypothetical protein
MADSKPGDWVIADYGALPPFDTDVEIDLGNERQPIFRCAQLRRDPAGDWWVFKDLDGAEIRIDEPRLINRLGAGKIWRWREPGQSNRRPARRPARSSADGGGGSRSPRPGSRN